MAEPIDVVCIGRSSVDLYGQQVGGRLEDMASFAKYLGGCPANIAVGASRLGLRSALVTGVGDEHMGRFLLEELARAGVDTSQVVVDPHRLTALVILGIRDADSFPLIFYRENCADAALTVDAIDPAFIAAARAVVVTGTHFSTPSLDAMSRKAMAAAREAGRMVVLDIDYRPVLWGLTGHGLGEARFVASDHVTAHLQTILPGCDVVVGTEEELHIAAGTTDTAAAIRRVRAVTDALIVCKRGPMGCVAFPPGPIPEDIEQGVKGPGFPVEVYNVLGAGDAFMSGLLRGLLRGAPLEEACRLANACGAFAVSRHGCAPAVPSWVELQHFLHHGSAHRRLREDATLEQIHWATTRRWDWPDVQALAFDHRAQLEALAARAGLGPDRIVAFKRLVWKAARRASAGEPFGILTDGRFGMAVLEEAAGAGCWIGRPIELPGAVPLRFEGGPDLGTTLREWPVDHVVKCLVSYHPDDPPELKADQERSLLTLQHACRGTSHELLIEVIASRSDRPVGPDTVAAVLRRFYEIGLAPDWWKLEPPSGQAGWDAIAQAIAEGDPHCRGVLLLGLEAPEEVLAQSFALARRQEICRGFAVGRTIFGPSAEAWFAGGLGDDEAVDAMARSFGRLRRAWADAAHAVAV